RIVDNGEDLEFVGDADVVAVGGEAKGDDADPYLVLDKRLDHPVLERHALNPIVRFDCHYLPARGAPPPRAKHLALERRLSRSGAATPASPPRLTTPRAHALSLTLGACDSDLNCTPHNISHPSVVSRARVLRLRRASVDIL